MHHELEVFWGRMRAVDRAVEESLETVVKIFEEPDH